MILVVVLSLINLLMHGVNTFYLVQMQKEHEAFERDISMQIFEDYKEEENHV